MNVAMVVSAAFPPVEGIGHYVWNLSCFLSQHNHRVQIITRGGISSTTRLKLDNITIWRPTFFPVYPLHVHLHAIFVDKLIRLLEPELDLIHLHTPLVKHPHTRLPSLVTVHTPMRADIAAVSASNLPGLLAKLQSPVSFYLEQQLFERARKITAVSNSVAAELAAYGIDPSQVAVFGNGVDTALFSPRMASQNISKPYILTVSRLAPRKGLDDLIQCAQIVTQKFPHVRFLIAGNGPLESALRNKIARQGLGTRIILLGHIRDRQHLADLYLNSAMYLHPAHYEGLPTALLEAMACGRPVIATAISGALDVIQDGYNGLLVPPRFPQDMAKVVLQLLNDHELCGRLGAAARKTIEQRYSWETVGSSYISQYEQLLSGTSNVAGI